MCGETKEETIPTLPIPPAPPAPTPVVPTLPEPTPPAPPAPTPVIPTPPVPPAPQDTKVNQITVTGISHNIAEGKKVQLSANILPENATDQNVVWSTSNPKVSTVNSKGLVSIKKKTAGKTVVITAKATDGSEVTGTYRIKVPKGVVKKITLAGSKTVKAGKTIKLTARVTATKGANTKLLWETNSNLVTVTKKGVVKASKKSKGKTVKVTVKSTDGSNKRVTKKIRVR